jgi:GT2 family glycosyltransferase
MDVKKILFVIVLYKSKLHSSSSFQTLRKSTIKEVELLVYDNSPDKDDISRIKARNIELNYKWDPRNPGLSSAYNYALEKALENKKEWLLLLDQDSTLTSEYLNEIQKINIVSIDSEVVAIAPRVKSNHEPFDIISPMKMRIDGGFKPIKAKNGIQTEPISAINSGSLFRVSFLKEINGFNPAFKLDFLDHWCYRKINRLSKKIYVINSFIHHDLSVSKGFLNNISITRYYSILNSEILFLASEGNLTKFLFRLRLIVRAFRFLSKNQKKFFSCTIKLIPRKGKNIE